MCLLKMFYILATVHVVHLVIKQKKDHNYKYLAKDPMYSVQ